MMNLLLFMGAAVVVVVLFRVLVDYWGIRKEVKRLAFGDDEDE